MPAAAEVFGRWRATVYRWREHYDPTDLRSRRPKQVRKRQWTAGQEQAVLDLRLDHPCSGKGKLHYLLRAKGFLLAESTIGRILATLKRRHLLIEPHAVREATLNRAVELMDSLADAVEAAEWEVRATRV